MWLIVLPAGKFSTTESESSYVSQASSQADKLGNVVDIFCGHF